MLLLCLYTADLRYDVELVRLGCVQVAGGTEMVLPAWCLGA